MNSPQILLSLKRGDIIDTSYYGSIYLAKGNKITNYTGLNPENIFFMRSLAKPLQAAIITDYNVINDYELSSKEIAIFCASHAGSPEHIKILKNLRKKLKIKNTELNLEAQKPLDTRKFNGHKTKLHNNCSAKHLMMLMMCKYLNLDTKNYTSYNHPLQKIIYNKQTQLSGYKSFYPTKDGCGTPLWGLSAESIIRAYYNLFHNKQYSIIIKSILENPNIFGGYDRLDTEIIELSKGNLFSKVGAGGFVLIYNLKEDSILLIKLTQNNNPIRKLIAMNALNELNWLKTNVQNFEYNQKKEKVAKYCYEFNFK